jgi:hypothetical protein
MMRETEQPTFWAAPELAQRGYAVFPLAGKVPAVRGGFYAATTDMSEIAMWIEEGFGDHDIGVATGHATGLVVIEADTPRRRTELEDRFGIPTVVTKKGAHWYFKHPRDGKVISRQIVGGVDSKADGAYVAAPPSKNKAWTNGIPDKKTLPHLPTQLREGLRPGNGTTPLTNGHDVDEVEQLEAAAVIARHVKKLAQGERHEHLRHLCGALLGRGVALESAEAILTKAWRIVGGELAERAPKEVPNTLRTTAAALAEGSATGVPSLEKLTPGLFGELEGILARKDPVLVAEESANGSGTAALPLYSSATGPALRVVRFTDRAAPNAREFLIPDLIPRYHPTTLYGWGGTAKSLIAQLLAMSVAGGREKFLDRDVAVRGPILFLDFELDADEQHRRVVQLAAGLEMDIPPDLLYVSALGVRTHEAISLALATCEEHGVVLVVLDSLGPAMVGDMAAAKDVIEFHNHYIAPFQGGRRHAAPRGPPGTPTGRRRLSEQRRFRLGLQRAPQPEPHTGRAR